ncbi:coronin-1A-like isoform X2 [Biomphalaria glabrata]|uniref:Coronin n=1 Tax=Biomphalaria glabrata TaxID=6526 RepID=A0A9W2ZCY1_BIOGL|nr:coronin-1A-like isoform X2 [Biomphalaria glabrata]
MSLKLRASKFRHVFGSQCRREQTFENVRITRNTHDSNFCSVNPRFLAVVTESSGGGAFAILDVNRPGRVDINCPKVCGHAGAVLDIKWNPFNDCVIASGSDDTTVKIWTVPESGLLGTLTDWSADLHGHSRRIAYVDWHTSAANVLMSVGFDFKIMVWNVEQAEPINSLICHTDTIYSACWGRDGSLIASTCKDKKIRVMDPRQAKVVIEMDGHQSTKTSKIVFVSDNQVFTTGFSRNSDRQYGLWDVRKSGPALTMSDLDCSSGILLPYYDPDIRVVYLAGKGDGNIRYFEIDSEENSVHFLNTYQSALPQRGLGMMPKRGIDPFKNEVARFYKLHASKNLVEPISMIVPRKAEGFQPDVFPPTASTIPSLTADEWMSGVNRGPILLDLESGTILDKPRSSMSPAVQNQIGALSKAPQITTYKAVNSRTAQQPFNSAQTPAPFQPSGPSTNLRPSPEGHAPVVLKSPSMKMPSVIQQTHIWNGMDKTKQEPASIKNIRGLSSSSKEAINDISPLSPSSSASSSNSFKRSWSPGSLSLTSTTAAPHVNGFNEDPQAGDYLASKASPTMMTTLTTSQKSQPSGTTRYSQARLNRGFVQQRANTIASSENAEHISAVKLVIGQPAQTAQGHLKKAYFRQLDEIKNLQEQLQLKDKRIQQLETELAQMKEREADLKPGESNC